MPRGRGAQSNEDKTDSATETLATHCDGDSMWARGQAPGPGLSTKLRRLARGLRPEARGQSQNSHGDSDCRQGNRPGSPGPVLPDPGTGAAGENVTGRQ